MKSTCLKTSIKIYFIKSIRLDVTECNGLISLVAKLLRNKRNWSIKMAEYHGLISGYH